jgi:hypothetical protein
VREANVQSRILIALSQAGCLVWRQNTGAFRDSDGVLRRYGLCVGSSDIIGIAPDGRFLAVEVKNERGRVSEAQERFVAAVRRAGGRAGIARSPEEAVKIATE